ncbi:MAG: class I SAM-dependent DNA methyltransferase [Candidatus Paceibacterota bacterium]
MANHSEIVSFIWSVADLIRDSFKRGHYQDVILPLTVLRRIDLVLAPTKPKVLKTYNKYKDKLDNLTPQLCRASGYSFYNTSKYDFETLLDEPQQLATNLRAYINGFSKNMRDVIEKFEFESTINRLESANLLFRVMQRFADKTKADLSPDAISNHEMGYVFEELIRKFNEALDENPGEHFTPREVVRLMASLLTFHDRDALQEGNVIRTVYDPCCGSGGMLTIGKEQIQSINPEADVHLFGQEVNPQTFAMCKSDLYMKSVDGRDADNIAFGSVLSNDGHADRTFDYLLANPPYGKDWNLDQDEVRKEAARASKNRFVAGLPRISDGQLLFLQHMLGRMHHPDEGVSRVSIIMNGSPLFTGDAKSGESEIRRWILENDYLEALIALPQQLFYNTGISTYVWVLGNKKEPDRAGKVLLIDASEAWLLRQKSLGAKRRDIPDGVERSENYLPYILKAFEDFQEQTIEIASSSLAPSGRGAGSEGSEPKKIRSKVSPTTAFGFRKVTVERPLRLNFEASPERIERIQSARAFQNLANSRKKDPKERQAEIEAGEATQASILDALASLPGKRSTDRAAFTKLVEKKLKEARIKVAASVRKAILDALSERAPDAPICTDKDGQPEADTSLRDTESVPLDYLDDEGVPPERKVSEFFEREVKPHVPDAWINESIRDEKDDEVGLVGYEINFNRYFYEYQPPRPLEDIEADIKAVEQDVLQLLREVAG